ncbi:unnamed protein product [Mesocestoides corti]|uniref:Transcriptional regulator n=1 Tax=Mesocestoides corti TaxID=53468 RepID=A0A0R3UI00_MESCO|nr:unnamed protein product [Mesocestoides corti]
MKNGKGKFIFHRTNQIMEGVWIDDVAKMSSLIDLEPRRQPTKSTYPIPPLKLEAADDVWRDAVEENMQILRRKYPQHFK